MTIKIPYACVCVCFSFDPRHHYRISPTRIQNVIVIFSFFFLCALKQERAHYYDTIGFLVIRNETRAAYSQNCRRNVMHNM